MKLKKIISATLAGVMLVGSMLVGSVSAADESLPFKDVGKKKWFYTAVKYVYDEKIMDGTSKTRFEPNLGLTRAMFITILGRMAGAETKETNKFNDIKKNSWYSGYVGWAVDSGVVTGYPDGTFKPDDNLSREEMAVAVDRYINYLGVRMTSEGGMWNFTDQKKVGKWAVNSLAVLRNSGVIEGDENGKFNPKASITRAEAATIVMKLKAAIENAWQGYLPTDGGDSLVFGASYIYASGSAFAGGMAHELDKTGTFPALKTSMSRYEATRTYHEANTAGLSINYNEIDVTKYPFVKIAYKYNGMQGDLSAIYSVDVTRTETRGESDTNCAGFVENLTLKAGADDEGMKTATIDLSAVNAAHKVNYSTQLANLLFKPCENSYDVDGSFDILYIGFFKTQAAADAFTANGDAKVSDYLKNYTLYSTLDYQEFTDELDEKYNKLLTDRIKEIKNSESAVTPADIKAAGGTAYYISSINGDDKNDGKSEKKPWKTFANLYESLAGGLVRKFVPKKGDGIFFERGSEFYAEKYLNYSVECFAGDGGVTYGAYGTGAKPRFSSALDFRDSGRTGKWVATEYPNVWRLDDDRLKYNWESGGLLEIGNIIFNDGEGVGVRIMPKSEDKCFGEGETSTNREWRCNGYEYFYTGVSDLTNPGTALKHNLEYIHDQVEKELYLYWDGGNPSDSFDEISVARNGYTFSTGENVRIDNLRIGNSTLYALNPGNKNVTVTNCEIAYVGGSRSSVESGMEIYGSTDGSYVYNCYIHDIGDGALTSQSGGGSADDPDQIENIEYIGNVMVACGHSVEIWNSVSNLDENGYSINRIKNVLVKDNIMAYNGYGFHQTQAGEDNAAGETVCGSMYGEFENCRLEGNLFLHGYGNLYTAYMATYEQPRGWMAKGNTYVANTNYYNIGYCYETLNHIDHKMWKRVRVSFAYSEEGLAWYTSLGVDPMGTYYYYSDNTDEYKEKGCFFMSGYYAERGGFELKER